MSPPPLRQFADTSLAATLLADITPAG